VRRTFDNAVQGAKQKGGEFNGDEWINAGSKYSGKRTGRGESPLQPEAMGLKQSTNEGKLKLSRAVNETKEQGKEQLGLVKSRANKRKAEVDSVPENIGYLERKAQATKNVVEGVKKRMPEMTPAVWSQRLNAAILGSPAGVMTGGMLSGPAAAWASGAATANVLSRPKVQRAIAGQTGKQQKLAAALKNYPDSPNKEIIDNLYRGATRGFITN
jgi:hypothetical protein